MNLKRAALALGITFTLFVGISPVFASTTCDYVDTGASGAGQFAKECGANGFGSKVKDALVSLSQTPADAAARLTENAVPASDVVTITIDDPSLLTPVDITYTTTGSESSVSIAQNLANNINSDLDVSPYVFALASGNSIILISWDDLSTYSTTSGTHISLGLSGNIVTVSGSARDSITWYMFTDHNDYKSTFATDGGPVNPTTSTPRGDAVGVNGVVGWANVPPVGNELYAVIFRLDYPNGSHTNSLIKHTTAHETGHILDYFYGQSGIMDSSGALLSGTMTDGDTITVTFSKNGDSEPQSYVIESGDTAADALGELVSAVNDNSALQSMGVHATEDLTGLDPLISFSLPEGVTYTLAVSSGATASWTDIGTSGRSLYSNTDAFRTAFAIDVAAINAQPTCNYIVNTPEWSPEPWVPMAYYPGFFSGVNDENGNPICGGDHDMTSAYSGTNLQILAAAFPTTNLRLDPSHITGEYSEDDQRA